jgi:hypothetical protein
VDFFKIFERVTLAGASNIPGMERFAVASTVPRKDLRPFVSASYSVDVAAGSTITASARVGSGTYGCKADLGLGVRYGVRF